MNEVAMSWSQMSGINPGRNGNHTPVRERIAAALRRAVAHSPSPATTLARELGLTKKGAALLLRGDTSPRAETLLVACRRFDEVWAEVQALTARDPADAEKLLAEMAQRIRERRG